ncbi:MAG: glycosyltransferase family 4 protein, partial [Clostridia bacterium]|nr:glycosyltransferase family 4 protein [Clostridia bacterium]
VFTFMMKPNIFGVAAAKQAKVEKIYSMFEGAGDVFIKNGLKWKAIRTLVCSMYRKSFRHSQKVFFLNEDDKKEFLDRRLVKSEQCEIIRGIGVDLEKFEQRPIQNANTFLMIARMLTTKGVLEYCKAARKVKQNYPNAVFNYIGGEGTLKISDINEYIDDGSINYLGTTKDVRPFIAESSVFVLPSYREGMPVSVMEAEATGRAVIVADNPGCRESIKDGYNGFLVNGDNLVDGLTEKIIWFLENTDQVAAMGNNSRQFAEENFDYKKINEKIIRIMGI